MSLCVVYCCGWVLLYMARGVSSSTLSSTSTTAGQAVDDDAEEVGDTVDDCLQDTGDTVND